MAVLMMPNNPRLLHLDSRCTGWSKYLLDTCHQVLIYSHREHMHIHHSSGQKMLFFFSTKKVLIFFLFLHKKRMLWYSLEVPHWGAFNEYHNIPFHWEIRKMFIWYPLLSRPRWYLQKNLQVHLCKVSFSYKFHAEEQCHIRRSIFGLLNQLRTWLLGFTLTFHT